MAKIKHTRNENGQNFTHQNKTTLFWRKKAKIKLHQNFPIYGMHRQKKYYDQKLSWQSFQQGDQVFVFFPNVKPGLTTKQACLWRGPFKVIVKITDVTFKINCGRKGKPQVIHVDRIRKKYPQNLPGEESEQIESYEETVAKNDIPNESMKTDKAMEFDSNKEISDNVGVDSKVQKSGRQKRKPAW